ncbi:MAG: pancreas/duodenum homeobox protein 1 [Desulfobulbaceae bacterium]|nr:pancreas/duodenum homeobox protein 1 [Desulfobulbaceae bacterium]
MTTDNFQEIFTDSILKELLPSERANDFFEALYGDIEEGSYDISLAYNGLSSDQKSLQFLINLSERPGKCLACHLTQGLPEVFSRHPIINIGGMVKKIDEQLSDKASCGKWHLGSTQTISRQLYAVPLTIELN